MGITTAQIVTSLRWLLTILGAWLVSKGYVTQDDVNTLSPAFMEWAGAMITFGSLVWSWWTHRKQGQINAVNKMSDKQVVSK